MASSRGGGCLRSVLAAVAAILFVVASLAALVLFNAEQAFLRPDLYKKVMVQQGVYERLPELVAEQLVYSSSVIPSGDEQDGETASDRSFLAQIVAVASPALTSCLQTELGPSAYADLGAASRQATAAETNLVKGCLRANGVPVALADTHGGMPIFFWMLSEQDWQAILAALLPPDWLRAQSESVIDQVYRDLQAGQPTSAIKIHMGDLKARLTGEEGFNAVVQLIDAQPSCTADQLAQIQGLIDPTAPLEEVPICRPPEVALTLIYPNIRATLASLAEQIPDEAEFKYAGEQGPSAQDPLESPRQALNMVRTAVRVALLVPIVLLALVALFGARSIKGLLRCWGIPLLVAGVLGSLIAAAGLAMTHQAVSNAILGGPAAHSNLAPGVLHLQVDILTALAGGYLDAFLVQVVAMALIGLAMIVVSFFVERPRPTSVAATPVAATPTDPPTP